MKFFLLFMITISATGCAVFNKSMPDTSFAPMRSCEKIKANFVYFYSADYGTQSNFAVDPTKDEFPAFLINSQLSENGFTDLKGQDPTANVVEITTHIVETKSTLARIWKWSTVVSLGIIPSWFGGEMFASARILSPEGRVLAEFESSKGTYSAGKGLIFLPFAFFHSTTRESFDKELFPAIGKELLLKIKDSGIGCSK